MTKEDIQLTSAEISALWRTYISDTMSICILKYFLAVVKDSEIKPILEFALQTSIDHINSINDIFNKSALPVPIGFTDDDVVLSAPPLFSDNFVLFNIRYLSRIGLNYYSITLPQMARPDIINFYTNCITSSVELTSRLIKLKLSKGIYIRPPVIQTTDTIDFVEDRSFLAGFFTEKRSLIVEEITQLFINIQSNIIGKSLLTGFMQVTETEQIRNYMIRGINIANKHIEIFSSKLKKEDIPISMPSDSFVTKSTEAPFSEKLMMFKLITMNAAGFENYSVATTTTMRHDIQADFIRLAAEIAKYGSDGLNIMIDNKWIEQPFQAINHAVLAKL